MNGIDRRFAWGLVAVTVGNYGWHYSFSRDFPPGAPWDASIAAGFVVASWPGTSLKLRKILYGIAMLVALVWLGKSVGAWHHSVGIHVGDEGGRLKTTE